ncbi:MAG: hypothetical protein AAFR57_07515 [Pseudomonadota bacterium]
MLLTKRHGMPAVVPAPPRATGSGGLPSEGRFGYFFPDAAGLGPGKTTALDRLAEAMVDQDQPDSGNSGIPPVFTYLGQFIDHDLTANTDRETDFSSVLGDEITPAPRSDVTAMVANLRQGTFDLDSLYGGLPSMNPEVERFRRMLRHPLLPAKMWIGTVVPDAIGTVPLPEDPATDLLRLDRVIRAPHQQITEAEILALPTELRDVFVHTDGTLRKARAIIGDGRNDENLVVAQFHLAMLRFHNKVVDHIGDQGGQTKRSRALARSCAGPSNG